MGKRELGTEDPGSVGSNRDDNGAGYREEENYSIMWELYRVFKDDLYSFFPSQRAN